MILFTYTWTLTPHTFCMGAHASEWLITMRRVWLNWLSHEHACWIFWTNHVSIRWWIVFSYHMIPFNLGHDFTEYCTKTKLRACREMYFLGCRISNCCKYFDCIQVGAGIDICVLLLQAFERQQNFLSPPWCVRWTLYSQTIVRINVW